MMKRLSFVMPGEKAFRVVDPETVPEDRKGLAESVLGRMARRGGTATVNSAPGEGTKITLKMSRSATVSR